MKLKLPSWFTKPSWFKWEPTGYWTMQTLSAVMVIWLGYDALFVDQKHVQIVIDAFFSGANLFNMFHNWLHRRRNGHVERLQEIAQEQQNLIRQIQSAKSYEIAQMIADRVNADIVSIQGPDGPINPNPTKH